MASFDIITATGHAYRFLWLERRYLVRIAAVPAAIKLLCHLSVQMLDYDTAFIRQALVMLPSYIADGWMVSHMVRFALFGQRRAPRGEGDIAAIHDRAQGILTGTATYALTRFLAMGLFAAIYVGLAMQGAQQPRPPAAPAEIRTEAFFIALALMACALWAFRLLWLYIPAAANVPMRGFMKAIGGMPSSLHMLGTWLICFLPPLFLFIILTSALVQPFGATATRDLPAVINGLLAVGWVATDTATEILAAFALSMGLKPFLEKAASA